jgi:hypothetical protein
LSSPIITALTRQAEALGWDVEGELGVTTINNNNTDKIMDIEYKPPYSLKEVDGIVEAATIIFTLLASNLDYFPLLKMMLHSSRITAWMGKASSVMLLKIYNTLRVRLIACCSLFTSSQSTETFAHVMSDVLKSVVYGECDTSFLFRELVLYW